MSVIWFEDLVVDTNEQVNIVDAGFPSSASKLGVVCISLSLRATFFPGKMWLIRFYTCANHKVCPVYNIKCAVLIVEEKRALQSQAKSDKSPAPQPAPPTPPSILSQRTIFLLDFFYIYLWLSSNPPFQVLQAILTDLKMLLSGMRWSTICGSLPERLNSVVTLICFRSFNENIFFPKIQSCFHIWKDHQRLPYSLFVS